MLSSTSGKECLLLCQGVQAEAARASKQEGKWADIKQRLLTASGLPLFVAQQMKSQLIPQKVLLSEMWLGAMTVSVQWNSFIWTFNSMTQFLIISLYLFYIPSFSMKQLTLAKCSATKILLRRMTPGLLDKSELHFLLQCNWLWGIFSVYWRRSK